MVASLVLSRNVPMELTGGGPNLLSVLDDGGVRPAGSQNVPRSTAQPCDDRFLL